MKDKKITSISIKSELKQFFNDIEKISVRQQQCTYSVAFNVKVKTSLETFQKIKKYVKSFESYECDISGDILSGGNTFVFVDSF